MMMLGPSLPSGPRSWNHPRACVTGSHAARIGASGCLVAGPPPGLSGVVAAKGHRVNANVARVVRQVV